MSIGFVTIAAATEKTRAANNQKKANQRENQQKRKREDGGELSSNESSRPEKVTNTDGQTFSDRQSFDRLWPDDDSFQARDDRQSQARSRGGGR